VVQAEQGDTFVLVRVSWFRGSAPQIDAAIEVIRDRIEPSLRSLAGYLGGSTMLDRAAGEGLSASFWQTAADMSAAEEMGVAARTEASGRAGVQLVDVDRFEILLQDRVAPAIVGSFVRVNELRASPQHIDAAQAHMADKGVQVLRSRKGFRALLMGANRTTGRTFVTSIWDSAADREASDATPSGLRDEVARLAQSPNVRINRYETVLSTVSAAAQEAGTAAAARGA
jgi:hypothetical protein